MSSLDKILDELIAFTQALPIEEGTDWHKDRAEAQIKAWVAEEIIGADEDVLDWRPDLQAHELNQRAESILRNTLRAAQRLKLEES